MLSFLHAIWDYNHHKQSLHDSIFAETGLSIVVTTYFELGKTVKMEKGPERTCSWASAPSQTEKPLSLPGKFCAV